MSQAAKPVVIVVGAAGGIGLEIVQLSRASARVVGVVQNDEQIAAACAAGAQECVVCDISESAAVAVALRELLALTDGRVDGLIITAAMQPVGAVEALPRQALERLFAVNVFGALELVQGLLPALRRSRGRVVLFSSMAGRLAAPLLGGYAATKFALEALADTLRRELHGSGVDISLIEPGGVDTPMAAAQGALAEQGLEKLDAGLREVYGPLYRGYRSMTAKALRFASTPQAVARLAVTAALDERRPKARYVAGNDARLMLLLARWLPTRWMDALLAKATRG
jgi:NAD(P)-dependent dehydrogenase (short-subunit alcohol dehydrogenase family)